MKDLVKLSLRDYFAALAMQGLLADGWCSNLRNDHYGEVTGERMVARDAYRIADAMLDQKEE
jgi:hypothetical protein